MRTIVHLSDLHFGRIHEPTTGPLLLQIAEIKPDLVVISGDLTQRARTSQFQAAKKFLEKLPQPQIVVPGNHDVPAYNLYRRFLGPLNKYRRNVTDELRPKYVDDEVAVFGLNSTLSFTTKYGELRQHDVAYACEQLTKIPSETIKMIVCHHPFDLPPDHREKDLIRGSQAAMQAFARCGVDVILTGHLHRGHTSQSVDRYRIEGHSALIMQAGTATSDRYRGELNSFNVLRVERAKLSTHRFIWNAGLKNYELQKEEAFTRHEKGWRTTDAEKK